MDGGQIRNPVARSEGLIKREVDGELLVYDLERDKAHCLNDSAARIWEYCDGGRSVPQITKLLESDLRVSMDESIVWHTLARLEKSHLLEDAVIPAHIIAEAGRREAIRKLGVVSLIAVPAITSMLIPASDAHASHTGCGDPPGPCPHL